MSTDTPPEETPVEEPPVSPEPTDDPDAPVNTTGEPPMSPEPLTPDAEMKLSKDQWISAASVRLNYPPEVVRAALKDSPDELNADQVESAIKAFLDQSAVA